MNSPDENKQLKNSKVRKQNEDLPNIPASSEKIKTGKTAHHQVKKTSKLHDDGRTENTEQNPSQ